MIRTSRFPRQSPAAHPVEDERDKQPDEHKADEHLNSDKGLRACARKDDFGEAGSIQQVVEAEELVVGESEGRSVRELQTVPKGQPECERKDDGAYHNEAAPEHPASLA